MRSFFRKSDAEAARRAAARQRHEHPPARLATIAIELADLDARHAALIAERTALIALLRSQGWTWDQLTTVTAVSRTALIRADHRATAATQQA